MAKRSLIIQGARFGDLVQTKRLIVSAGANRKIALVADARLKELAAIIYPDTEFYGINFHGAPSREGVIENSTIFGELREQDFAEIYNCNFSPLTTSICRLFPEDKIINYRPARDSAGGISRGPWARLIFRLSRFRKSTPLNIAYFWGWLAPFPNEGKKINPVAIPGGKGLG
nr:heptosyltransferase [Desulfovibrio sp.]